ncbi:MAG: polysaccharide deacetylase family protein [Oscillospiraceae bacterium]|jgi:peptidoglycan/xylan/chitin deacetylase (PgdA/CDA1 family)|nr:polysaccharide deacetylase family protein [Oscillospiraceae bacterium]
MKKITALTLAAVCAAITLTAAFACQAALSRGTAYATESGLAHDVNLPVLMYHNVVTNPARAGEYSITPATFERDMQYLLSRGYTTVSVSDVLAWLEDGATLPRKPVLVTFDDGQCGVWHYLRPIMERLGVKVTVNIEGAYTDRDSAAEDHNPEYSNLTWTELAELSAHPLYELGNHTYNMHSGEGYRLGCKRRPGESAEAYAAALTADVERLQSLFESRCRVSPNVFAYPFGFISDESMPILTQLGFKALLTCYERTNVLNATSELPLVLHRYNRSGSVSTETYMARLLGKSG